MFPNPTALPAAAITKPIVPGKIYSFLVHFFILSLFHFALYYYVGTSFYSKGLRSTCQQPTHQFCISIADLCMTKACLLQDLQHTISLLSGYH